MTQSKLSLPLALLLLFVMACTCGKLGNRNSYSDNNSNNSNSSTSNSNESNDNRSSNDNSSTGNKNTSTTSGNTASTGIAECDEYLKMIDDYLSCPNLPEATREQWRNQRSEMFQRFKEAGKTDVGKSMMVEVCKKAAESSKEGLKCR